MRITTKGISPGRMWKPLLRTVLLLTVLYFGMKMPKVQAQTVSTSVSHGNVIYEGKRGRAALYAADIHLLEEKISTIPEQCFDPVCYAHIHNWEYCRINENTHTKHCADCGDTNDLTSFHRADSWEYDTIFYEGKTYPGKRYTCACGYQWSMELSHTMIYEAVDEVNHRSRCAQDGTPYCKGYEPIIEEHYAWYYEMGGNEFHHKKICFDCGFWMEETCHFDETEGDESRRVCVCGRSAEQEESEPPETSDEPETGEAPEAPAEPETGEPPETPDEPGSENPPEDSDEPEYEDSPETPDEPEYEDAPGTGDAPESPDPPDTGDVSVAALKYGLIHNIYVKNQKEDFEFNEKI